jgi:ubiquinone/menaquinone biosynthesis C-methylase UbiE
LNPAAGRDLLGDGLSLPVRRYRDRLLARLGLPEGRGRKALDLGCGDGMEALWLAERGWNVEAYDLDPHPRWKAVARAARGRIKFARADATRLGRLKGRYALVFQKDMLHHVQDPAAALKHMRRLTAPGGSLVVLECNRRNPVFYLHLTLMKGHQHFTLGRLRSLMDGAGMGDAALTRIEARVWPLLGPRLQDLAEGLENLAEALPPWRPFICYHAMQWRNGKAKA